MSSERSVTAVRESIRSGRHRVAAGEGTLSVIGLGSCVAVILYDDEARVGALAHVLLPDPSLSSKNSNRMKFVTTAVPDVLEEMVAAGAVRGRIRARIVGGASMFGDLLSSERQNIGERNVTAARETLANHGIEVIGEDVGGEFGRTLFFELNDGTVRIRSPRRDEDVFV